jgi:hypothetical protein
MPARAYFRAHERRRVDFPAKLCFHDGSAAGPSKRDVRVRDLGLGGAGIEIPEGERELSLPVTIELWAPVLWDPLVLEGKIAWVRRGGQGRPARAGVRFEHREPATLYGLFQFLGAHVQGA